VLALFMLGYVLWATDRLARLSRARAAAPALGAAAPRPSLAAVTVPAAAISPGAHSCAASREQPPGRAALAPRLAACYKIAMGIVMGYMLVMML
jgi:hypothetical protein